MSARKRRILVVDDEPDLVELVSFFLEDHGFEVRSGLDLAEAATALSGGPFDLILTDYALGKGTGLDVIRLCESLGGAQNQTRIVVMTGSHKPIIEQTLSGLLQPERWTLLVKPFQEKNLSAVLKKFGLI